MKTNAELTARVEEEPAICQALFKAYHRHLPIQSLWQPQKVGRIVLILYR